MNRWYVFLMLIYLNNGKQPSDKKEWVPDFLTTWMNLKMIMLRERSQTKSAHCIIPFRWNSRKCKLIYRERQQICANLETLEMGWEERDYRGGRGNFWVRDIFFLFIVVIASWVLTCTKTFQILPITYVCHLYLHVNYNTTKLF